ncbi:MAG: copper homeostasis protein CutC [Oscillospiraceae bacterium]|nr:copper homeostasis protein CutC [Oscillospiraceae bacterium]
MKDFTLEVCIDSVESAIEAAKGGATRYELCANLIIGGTTPSIYLFREIRKLNNITVHAIIRPRFGDFCYTDSELRIMAEEIKQFKDEGVEGIVTGVLKPDGTINMPAMETLCKAAGGIHVALHRAFDMCKDPFDALKQAEQLGIGTILTGGQQNNCIDGAELIKEIAAKTSVDIMAGSGVSADTIPDLRKITGVSSYHLSGKVSIESPMLYRNPNLKMGLPSMSEFEIQRTSSEKIAAVRKILEEID